MRRIEIFGDITEENTYENTSIILDFIKNDEENCKEKIEPLYVYINSQGGPMFSYYCYRNIFKLYKGEIITINMCLAESSAFHIFMLGDERKCFRDSKFLLHSYSSSYDSCKRNNILDDIKETDEYFKNIWIDISNNSKITLEFINEIINSTVEKFFYYNDALEFGIITESLE